MKSSMRKPKMDIYNDVGGSYEKEAMDEKPDFRKGGKVKKEKKKHHDGGHAHGHSPKHRLDRKPRASGGRSPYSSAEKVSGGAEEDEGGKRDVTGPGAETEISTYKKGGKVHHMKEHHKKHHAA